MSNYTINVDWDGKDALADSNAAKVISGDDFQTEFETVQTAVNSKANLNGSSSEDFAINSGTVAGTFAITGVPTAPTQSAGNNTTRIATTAFVTTAASALNAAAYPIGSIFTTTVAYADSDAVVTAIGGTTWVAFGAGKVLVGLDAADADFDTIEETGGSKTHTLTASEMNHWHGIGNGLNNDDQYTTGRSWSGGAQGTSGSHYVAGEDAAATPNSGATLTAGSLGSTDPILNSPTGHNNVQPYITVYFWKRTA